MTGWIRWENLKREATQGRRSDGEAERLQELLRADAAAVVDDDLEDDIPDEGARLVDERSDESALASQRLAKQDLLTQGGRRLMPTPSEMYDEGWHQGYLTALYHVSQSIGDHATELRENYRSGNVDIAYISGIEWAENHIDEQIDRREECDRSRSRTPDEAVPGDAPADPSDSWPGGLLAG